MSAKDFMRGSFTSNAYRETEDADPRVGLVNLADVMLVFACGLMLALVSAWNLDVSRLTEVAETGEFSEVSGIEEFMNSEGSGTSFTQLGMVYQDPMTGKMYMLREDVEGIDTGAEGATGSTGVEESSDTGAVTGANVGPAEGGE